jgi:cyanophycinase
LTNVRSDGALSEPPPSNTLSPRRGALIAIGGAEDKVGARAVLRQVVHHAGGRGAKIALFPTGSSIPVELATTYDTIFRELGAEVRVVRIITRADGDDPETLAQIEGVTGIFFTGGDQGRIVTMLGGTELARTIRRAHRSGVVVAGTSAGASVICDHMIAQGKKGYAPRRDLVMLAPGLGLTRRLVIDQHFAQRHRIGRLFSAVALNPFLIGVGIDEDTAIVVTADKKLQVIGRGTVTVIDGSKMAHSDIHEVSRSAPAAVMGLSVHVLTQGSGFDVDARTPILPKRVVAESQATHGPKSERAAHRPMASLENEDPEPEEST